MIETLEMIETPTKTKRKKIYEKPTIVKCGKMIFPIDIIEASGETVVCRQCSGCHGCR